jgi:beta-glucosidase
MARRTPSQNTGSLEFALTGAIMTANTINTNHSSPEVGERVEALLGRMTLEEKVGQMAQINVQRLGRGESEARIRRGQAGSVLNLYGAAELNALQRSAVEVSRLGIPLLFGNDVIHGYRTIFPIPLAEACTWDPALLEQAARIAAEEASADGTHWIFGPMIDVCRDPRWGRIAEGAGEDPFLGAAMARARVRGFQAADLESGRKIVACPKHYAGYGAAEGGRDYNSVDISERTLRDVYLPPFRAALDSGAGTVMSAFCEIGGLPIAANPLLLDKILRREWGFAGVVLSDWDAIGELVPHGLAADLEEAARLAALTGVDMDMTSDAYHGYLAALVRRGAVLAAIVDEAVRRILRLKFMLGLFERPYADESAVPGAFLRLAYRERALEVACKSMVLLKNEGGLLPLGRDVRRIALIGPLADDHHEVLGCWHRIGRDEDAESVLDGLRAVLPAATAVTHVAGCDLDGQVPPDLEGAAAQAERADVAVVVVGEGEAMSGEAHSRAHLGLPGHQQALVEAVQATGTPLVVVLMSGRPLAVPWLADHVPALLQAWHGGIRAGRAVADVLTGAAEPGGRLTATWPRSEGQIPIYYAHKNTGRPPTGPGASQYGKIHRTGYIDQAHTPLYPFGYGLGYTTFAYSDLAVETLEVGLDGMVVAAATVTNTGPRPGDEVVQLYVRDVVGSVTRPVKELKGFRRISLAAGESRRVRFEVPVDTLGFHGPETGYTVEPGEFCLWIGPHAAEGLAGSFWVVD